MEYDRELIREMFVEESMNVWSNYNPMTPVEVFRRERWDSSVPLMAIRAGHHDRRQKAIGNSLIWRTKGIKLFVTDESLELLEKEFRSLLRHESIHIGYPNHDKDFMRLAGKVDAPENEFNLDSKTEFIFVEVQDRPRERFRVLKKYEGHENLEVARAFADKSWKSGKYNKLRLKRSA